MNSVDMKHALIKSTIEVIGKEGIDKATTSKISKKANLNEVYIYRLFGSKEKLFIDVFSHLDVEFFGSLYDNFSLLENNELNNEYKWKQYFEAVWDFVLSNHDRAMTYIYYYYSKFYSKYPREKRKETFRKAKMIFAPLFKEDVDFSELFDYVLDILFTSVLKVIRNEVSEDISRNKVFKLIYMVIKPSLKGE